MEYGVMRSWSNAVFERSGSELELSAMLSMITAETTPHSIAPLFHYSNIPYSFPGL